MRFEFNGKQYSLEFQREFRKVSIKDKLTPRARHLIESTYPYTRAKVLEVDPAKKGSEWKVVAAASVGCAPMDKYTIEAGRLFALKKLTKVVSKEMRKPLWEAYHKRLGKTPVEKVKVQPERMDLVDLKESTTK